MDWLRHITIIALLIIAIIAGGTAVRLAVVVGDGRAAVVAVLVAGLLILAVIGGARDRRWRQNPYW